MIRHRDNWAASAEEIDASWRSVEKGLQYAATVAREELGWANRRWLPSANALIPIAYLFKSHIGSPSKEERESLKRYLLLTGLRGLFRGSVETSINTFVNPIKTAQVTVTSRTLSNAESDEVECIAKPKLKRVENSFYVRSILLNQ